MIPDQPGTLIGKEMGVTYSVVNIVPFTIPVLRLEGSVSFVRLMHHLGLYEPERPESLL